MGIDTERDIEANLQVGPTDKGMVRIYVEADGIEIPMDFSPDLFSSLLIITVSPFLHPDLHTVHSPSRSLFLSQGILLFSFLHLT